MSTAAYCSALRVRDIWKTISPLEENVELGEDDLHMFSTVFHHV